MPTYTAWPGVTYSVTDLQDETSNPASTADAHLKVTDSNDATFIAQIDDRAQNCYAEFGMSSDMDNPTTVDDMTVTLRCELHGNWKDDTLNLKAQVFQQDGATPLSDNVQFCTASEMTTGNVVDYTFPLTGLVNDINLWANNQFWLHWEYIRSKGADGIYISVKQITITGNYTQAAPVQQMVPENIVQQSDIVQSSITQEHILNPDHISQQSQIEENQAVQEHETTAEHISQQSEIVESTVGIPVFDVEGEHISQQGEIVQGVVTQYVRVSQVVEIISDIITHEVVGENIVATPAIEQGAVTAQSDLIGENIVQQSAIVQAVVDQESNLVSQHISQQGQITWSVATALSNLVGDHISQQSEIEESAIEGSSELVTQHIEQRSAIVLSQVSLEHNTVSEHIEQQGEITQGAVGASGELLPWHISQQSEIEQGVLVQEYTLVEEHIEQQSEIEQSAITFEHNLNIWHISAQGEIQKSFIAGAGELIAGNIEQQSEITRSVIAVEYQSTSENVVQQSEITQAAVWIQEPDMKTTSVDYKHPYATLYWRHRPSGGEWQDVINLSGYVSGQGTKTLTLNQAAPEEAGYLQCVISNPAGAAVYTREAVISGSVVTPVFTVHPQALQLDETPVLQFVTHPTDQLVVAAGITIILQPQDLTLFVPISITDDPDNLRIAATP